MNYKYILNIIGKVLRVEAVLMLFPLIVGLIYKEPFSTTILSFMITIAILLVIGFLLNLVKPKNHKILPRSSFIVVSLSWLLMSLFGSFPLMLSGEVPNFFNAFFEMCSGFTTTGASIIKDVEALSHSILFWRSFSHWIGGMGVIVFILAIFPDAKEGTSMHILRAESPGPQVGKLVSKMGVTARILYFIYLGMTLIEFLFLSLGPDKKMDLFSSITFTFSTAGTGGFSISNSGIAEYSTYSQYVIAIFMILFGINFSLFYLLLIKKYKTVVKNDEVKVYLFIVIFATAFITANVYLQCKDLYSTFEESFRHSFFQVASLVSTTGFVTTNYELWPTSCIMILLFLTFMGACAGSTAGGFKVSRLIILIKSVGNKMKTAIHPRKIDVVSNGNGKIEKSVIEETQTFFTIYMLLLFVTTFLISFDGFDVMTSFTASLSCISNVGLGLGKVGSVGNFSEFSSFSKFILSFLMIAGRLELFPIIALFNFKTWKKR